MYPVLFEVNGFAIHTYGAMGAIGFLAVAFLSMYRGRLEGYTPERIVDIIFWTAISAIVGSRVLFIIQNPEGFDGPASWANIRTGGLVFYGALIAGIPAASLLMKRFGMPFFKTWDMFATALPLGHAFARIGCFGAGCCYGLPHDGPLGVTYSHALTVAPKGISVYPVQLFEAAALFAIAGTLNWFYSRKQFDGQVMLLYLMLYAVTRTLTEMFRGDPARGHFLPQVFGEAMSYSQGVSAVFAVLALAVFFVGARNARKPVIN